jgi:hypothetical protein
MFLSAGLTQGALGRGAGGRGENSSPLLPCSLLPAPSSPPTLPASSTVLRQTVDFFEYTTRTKRHKHLVFLHKT